MNSINGMLQDFGLQFQDNNIINYNNNIDKKKIKLPNDDKEAITLDQRNLMIYNQEKIQSGLINKIWTRW